MTEDNSNSSVFINIPKLRVNAKKSEELVNMVHLPSILKSSNKRGFRKPSETATQKYCLVDHKPMSVDKIRREEILLSYKMYSKKQVKDKGKHILRINMKETHRIRQTDLQKRLFVEDPPNDVSTVIDIDKDFYNFVNGRPLRKEKAIFKSLKAATADVLRLRTEIGFRNDAILNIDINQRHELEMYELSFNRCMKQAKYFDTFISEDYLKSMSFLKKWDDLKMKLHLKVVELQHLGNEQFTIISRLMGLDYQFHLQQKYGRFLYYLSPPSWRSKHRDFAQSVEIEAKGFDLGYSNEDETFKVVFEEMQKQSLNPVHPVLYFTKPGDLMDIFNGIEKHLYHNLDYVSHLIPQKKRSNQEIKYIKKLVTRETALVYDTIKGFEKIVEFENEKCDQLKQKFFSVLNGLFYESVGTPDVLKLYIHLEFCYERVYIERPMNMDIKSIARSLEKKYMDYNYVLDYLHSNAVKAAVTKAINKERMTIKRAKYANRELYLFNRLEKQLQRAHEPIADKSKPIMQATPMTKPYKSRKHELRRCSSKTKIEKPLTDSELEYLTLFTDWTKGENPDDYLHRVEDDDESQEQQT